MKRVVGIVQARMGSRRLPEKSMIELRGRPIIEHVVRRVQRAQTLTQVVLATSNQAKDDVLCDVADRLDIQYFRGSENDVLKRFLLAAQAYNANVVVRVCADNPLVAPEEIDRIVLHHLRTGADYSFNHIPLLDNFYPDGLGAEVVNFNILEEMNRKTGDQTHREHVTSYIWDHSTDFHIETIVAPKDIAGSEIKLDIDTETDIERLRLVFNEMPPGTEAEAWDAKSIIIAYRRVVEKST